MISSAPTGSADAAAQVRALGRDQNHPDAPSRPVPLIQTRPAAPFQLIARPTPIEAGAFDNYWSRERWVRPGGITAVRSEAFRRALTSPFMITGIRQSH